MGLREWVIGLAIVFMVVLAADAWRRIRQQKQYRGAYVKPQTRQGGSNDTVRVSRVAGRAPVTAPSAYSHRRPPVADSAQSAVEPQFDEELDDTPEGAGNDATPTGARAHSPSTKYASTNYASSTAGDAEPGAASAYSEPSAEEPVTSFDTPYARAASRSRGASQPASSLREKVPMLLDSVDDPEPEPDIAAEDQFEFDLQPPDENASPSVRRTPVEDADDERWEDDIDPDDVLLSRRGTQGRDFASEFSDSVPGETARGNADPDPEERPASGTTEPSIGSEKGPADVSPYAHLQRSFNPHAEDPEPESDAFAADTEVSEPEHNDGFGGEYSDTFDDEAGDQLLSEPEQVLVMTVLARPGEEFEGASLLQILLACGMRFGNMNIFHATDEDGHLQYSAANAYNPGTFDLDHIEHFATRGVTFFMQLPCRCKAMEGFEAMYQTAATLASNMNGEILDDTRSVMTTQTLTHYQERIRDYQRAQLVKRA